MRPYTEHASERRFVPRSPTPAAVGSTPTAGAIPLLTPAEWEAVSLMALGMSDKMVAVVRGTTTHVERARFSRINRKLGTGNRVGILKALGWLHVPDDAVAAGTAAWQAHKAAERAQAIRTPRTHCREGHPLSGPNLYLNRGRRLCRECEHERGRQRVRKKPPLGT